MTWLLLLLIHLSLSRAWIVSSASSMGCTLSPRYYKLSLPRNIRLQATNKAVVQGVGDEGCRLPSASRVNTLPESQQSLIVAAIFLGLAGGSFSLIQALQWLDGLSPWMDGHAWTTTFPLLGAIYALAGYAHLAFDKEFCNIMPAEGAWGWWRVPGSKFFHVLWTGVAEIVLGLGLFSGYIESFLYQWELVPWSGNDLMKWSALGLFFLTIVVTPSNIYSFTHGARLPMAAPELTVSTHAVRGVMQCVLLAFLFHIYLSY